MKAVRLLQILVVIAAIAYLVLLHDMNEVNVVLPFFISLPPAAVIVMALALGWILGWLPPTFRGFRRRREMNRLRQRVSELERTSAPHLLGDPETPVIPDRARAPEGEQEPLDEDVGYREKVYSEHENL